MVDGNDEGATAPSEVTADADADTAISPTEEVQIDPDGDLTLCADSELQEPEKSFRVCSSALRRSSAVWEKMLFGPFKESKPEAGAAWMVDLPEDDPSGLEILLHIVHANFLVVPQTPTLTEIYEVMRLANKYDMIPALKPWAETWLSVAKHFSRHDNDSVLAKAVYIAWEFGQVDLQTSTMRELIFSCTVNADGLMVTNDDVILDNFGPIGPPDLLGNSGICPRTWVDVC